VSEIWITFPDPQPQKSREKKRLTNPFFLAKYREILLPEGIVHLKTDNDDLFVYTQEKLTELGLDIHAQTSDLYRSDVLDEVLSIKTYYEKKYLETAKNINYIKWGW